MKKISGLEKNVMKEANESYVPKISLLKSDVHFKRIKIPGQKDIGHGEYFLLLDVVAGTHDLYIPLSLASGKKPTGFIYHIEGNAEADINTTGIKCKGDGVTNITLGTLLYAKIPAGKKAEIRLLIEIRGGISKEYKVVINRINYKLDLSELRYRRLDVDISSKLLRFSN